MSRANPDYSDEEEARGKAGRAILEAYADTIRQGMAESLWILAYAQWAEDNREIADEQLGVAKPGGDWADVALSIDLPKAAEKAAKDLYALYEKANGNMVELFALAEEADMEEPFSFSSEVTDRDRSRFPHALGMAAKVDDWKMSDALEFGQGMAAMALGEGIGWFDDHKEFAYEKVRFECHYDGDELTWSGGTQDVREANKRIGRIVVVNDTSFYRHKYLLRVGIHYLLIGAAGIDSAIDEMIDWIAENENDLIVTQQVNEEYRRLMLERGSDPLDYDSDESQEALREAEADTTQGGNSSDYIMSESWSIVAEDPSEADLVKFGRERNPAPSSRDRFSIAGVTNPAGRYTRKGERMYQAIKRGYQQVGEQRAKEIAARTVEKAAKHGARGLVKRKNPCDCTPNPTVEEFRNPELVKSLIREGLDAEFAQKVVDITLRPSPITGKVKTVDQFKDDLAANLATGLMLEEDY